MYLNGSPNRRKPLGEVDSNIHHRPVKRQRVIAVGSESENAFLPQGQNSQDTPEIVQQAHIHYITGRVPAQSAGPATFASTTSILKKSQVG
jgi:hypothetical protein